MVLFNGQGQSREQQYHGSTLRGYLYHLLDGGNIRYLLANGTGPVSDNFSRNFRHFLWMDNVIYMIDDLKTHRSGEFEWLWHPGGEWKKSGTDVTITKITLRWWYVPYILVCWLSQILCMIIRMICIGRRLRHLRKTCKEQRSITLFICRVNSNK